MERLINKEIIINEFKDYVKTVTNFILTESLLFQSMKHAEEIYNNNSTEENEYILLKTQIDYLEFVRKNEDMYDNYKKHLIR